MAPPRDQEGVRDDVLNGLWRHATRGIAVDCLKAALEDLLELLLRVAHIK